VTFPSVPTCLHAGLGLAATLALILGGCGRSAAKPEPAKPVATPAQAAPAKDAGKLRTGGDIPFEHSWDLDLKAPVHLSWVSENIPELIFFQVTGSNAIYGVDAASGHTVFVTPPLPKPIQADLPAYAHRVTNRVPDPTFGDADESKLHLIDINEDRLFVISDDTLFSIDATHGQIIWRFQLPFAASSGPCAVGADTNLRVFIGDYEGRIQAVTYHPTKHFAYPLWQWNLQSSPTAVPSEREGLVYVGDHKGVMRCFELDRGTAPQWEQRIGGHIFGSSDPRGRSLYVGSDTNTFTVFNRLSGEKLASLYLNAPITRAPFHYHAEPGRVYVWTDRSADQPAGLFAINTQSDNIPYQDTTRPPLEVERVAKGWFLPGATRLVSSTPDHLYVMKATGTVVHAVNRGTGKVDWAWDVNSHGEQMVDGKVIRKIGGKAAHIVEYHDPTDGNRSLFAIDDKGQVVAYRFFGYRASDKAKIGGGVQPMPSAKPRATTVDVPKKAPTKTAPKPAAEAK